MISGKSTLVEKGPFQSSQKLNNCFTQAIPISNHPYYLWYQDYYYGTCCIHISVIFVFRTKLNRAEAFLSHSKMSKWFTFYKKLNLI